jgi:hypothetical protein
MRALTMIPSRPRGSAAPSPTGRLARARRAMQEMSPDAIEQIAQRVAQLLRHEPESLADGQSKSPELIDAEELAKCFGLTRAWVYENAGKLGAIPLSDGPRPRLRFDPETVAEVLKSRQRRNQPVPVSDSIPRPPRSTRRRRTPSTVPLLPIHEPRVRGLVTRSRPAHQKGDNHAISGRFSVRPTGYNFKTKTTSAPDRANGRGPTFGGVSPMPAKKPSRRSEHGHHAGLSDIERVLDAMRSGEWLRTQWITRVALGLGTAPWRPAYGTRMLAVLRRLESAGHVIRRNVEEVREGEIEGVPVAFPIPRTEWRLSTTEGGL